MIIKLNEPAFRKDELTAAKLLAVELGAFFNQNPCDGEINILNYQLPAGYLERDIDILILLKVEEGHSIKFRWKGVEIRMEGGFIFNVETKLHSHFTVVGNGVMVKYQDGSEKNASNQAWNVKNNLLNYLKKEFKEVPLIRDLVFLPMCSRETSLSIFGDEEEIPQNLLDASFTASKLFGAVTLNDGRRQYGSLWSIETIDCIKNFLLNSKSLPSDLLNKLELLTINSFKDEQDNLFSDPSDVYILRGSPGAGKTILMLSKCRELLGAGKKCLYLTYNRQLVLDLQRLQDVIKFRSQFSPLLNLRIETWDSFIIKTYTFHNYFSPLGSRTPTFDEKTSRIHNRYNTGTGKQLLAADENKNSNNIFRYSQVDYVFVDEAQDLPSAVFEILERFFPNNICLAMGGQQEYSSTELRSTRNEIFLEKIHRQKELPSRIVNAFLEYTKMNHTYKLQTPVPYQLVGGKSMVYTGVINENLYKQVFQYLELQGGSNIDFLHLHIKKGDTVADTTLPHYHGGNVEEENSLKLSKFRYYHYNSCRGLEANVVLYEKIDGYYDWCVETFGEEQAKKRLFIALTRVKDVAIFTFKDLNHWLYTDVVANWSRIKNFFDLE